MPKQIDLEPKDYRADPLPGEPAMHEEGPANLAIVFAWIGLALFLGLIFKPVAHHITVWLRALVEG